MKSRVSFILALLLILSAGLTQPLHAAGGEAFQACEMDLKSVSLVESADTEGPGDTTETLGDPDGWLGGQNFQPGPVSMDGVGDTAVVLADRGASFQSLLSLILMFIGF